MIFLQEQGVQGGSDVEPSELTLVFSKAIMHFLVSVALCLTYGAAERPDQIQTWRARTEKMERWYTSAHSKREPLLWVERFKARSSFWGKCACSSIGENQVDRFHGQLPGGIIRTWEEGRRPDDLQSPFSVQCTLSLLSFIFKFILSFAALALGPLPFLDLQEL